MWNTTWKSQKGNKVWKILLPAIASLAIGSPVIGTDLVQVYGAGFR